MVSAKSSSPLQGFDRVVITNGVGRSVFHPIDMPTAKTALGIDRKYPLALLCGFSGEPRKRLDHFVKEIDKSQLMCSGNHFALRITIECWTSTFHCTRD